MIHGSCYEVLPKLECEVQCVFADPPYNLGFDYGNGSKADSLPADQYLAGIEEVIALCVEKLAQSGSIWVLSPERWADQIGAMLSSRLSRRNRVIWRETFGQYREDKFPGGHRHLFWHVMDEKRTPFNPDELRVPSKRMLNGDKRAAGPRVPDDVWEVPRLVGNASERIGSHPCQLPEELLRRVILSSTNPGDSVLDPMSGTGTTARVAQTLGRNYVAIEEQEDYVAIINKRLERPIQRSLFR